ncbi:MAG TPA: cation transporter [Woeseiaceae bacterium]|jgi:Co/Zn/Cd efflux system component|nr:cation transporter [Woeseiaceae bacterium]
MTDSCCGGTIDVGTLRAVQRRILGVVLAINLATFVMMILAGIVSGSSSLLSGTLDNLGDAVTYALSLAVVGASGGSKARVALFKGVLISTAAAAVAVQIGWRLWNPHVPVAGIMSAAATANLAANVLCLRLLTPYRKGDVNMASAWECSRNDVAEGFAVIAAAAAVWLLDAGWPDLIIAGGLLALFLRSAARVLTSAWRELKLQPVE